MCRAHWPEARSWRVSLDSGLRRVHPALQKTHSALRRRHFALWRSHLGRWRWQIGLWKTQIGLWKRQIGRWKRQVGLWRRQIALWKSHFAQQNRNLSRNVAPQLRKICPSRVEIARSHPTTSFAVSNRLRPSRKTASLVTLRESPMNRTQATRTGTTAVMFIWSDHNEMDKTIHEITRSGINLLVSFRVISWIVLIRSEIKHETNHDTTVQLRILRMA